MTPLPLWLSASLAFFVYVGVVAALPRGLSRARRLQAWSGTAIGLLVGVAAPRAAAHPVLYEWVLPIVLLLVGYWTSGRLFVAPMPHAERVLIRTDEALAVRATAARMPRAAAELLELGYGGIYPLIPIALAIHLIYTPSPDPDRFWAVVLVTDYVCFAMLPWIQTRPPRAFDTREPWHASLRTWNLRLLGTASIQVNTFPSGHAAEAMATFLLVLGAPWPLVTWMACNVVAISAGAVYGRYHYAADALAGWVVAVAVWWLVT
jgi:membrane-associated phospholipid phosphatase